MKTIRNLQEWDSTRWDSSPPGPVTGVLVGPPLYFDITDVRNEHMKGQIGNVDKRRAQDQWETLCDKIRRLGITIHELDPMKEQVDAVFTANPSLCTSDRAGLPRVIIGRMNHPNRVPESDQHRQVYQQLGLHCDSLPAEIVSWEGNGDSLRDLQRPLLWCGLGPRSEEAGHVAAGQLLGLDLALLELPTADFYHLDTALALLNESTAAFVREAFTAEGIQLLEAAFENLIEVDPNEAKTRLAGNMWCPDGSHVFITSQTPRTCAHLTGNGFQIIEVDTGEFLKSGGSVFCMRQEIRDVR